jgi:hypothetical protein
MMKPCEYKNDYFYFVVRPGKKEEKDVLIYCSGINVTRFLPMMQGRLGLGSNPIVSGLQLVKYDLCTLAHARGATPKEHYCNPDCGVTPPTRDGWYTEPLLIQNPGDLTPEEIVGFAVKGMVKRINAASLSGTQVPDDIAPAEMQKQLETLCRPS